MVREAGRLHNLNVPHGNEGPLAGPFSTGQHSMPVKLNHSFPVRMRCCLSCEGVRVVDPAAAGVPLVGEDF